MKRINDTSNMCWECTGAGKNTGGGPCKVCGSKGTLSDEDHFEDLVQKAYKAIGFRPTEDRAVLADRLNRLRSYSIDKLKILIGD
jgi:hypothetical protein